jgi:acyl-CoA synthetase (AMP-forming)/AMP-acid ligase II
MAGTFVDVLGDRAVASAGLAFEFVDRDGTVLDSIGYPELAQRARAVGAALTERGLTGQRVLLSLPAGPEYVTALFGCLYAGAVAVPLPPGAEHRRAVVDDAAPAAAIVSPYDSVDDLADVTLLTTADLDGDPRSWRRPDIGPDTLALLQYPDGTDSYGVMVTHANLVASADQLERHFGATEDTGVVSWLPPYHDMGLLGGILQPVYTGSRAALLSPAAGPATWLRLVTERRARIGYAPRRGYEETLPDRELAGLDLSTLEVAVTEASAPEEFADRLAPYGFRRSALFPCYWLPEATALVAGRPAVVATSFDEDSLSPGRPARPAAAGTAVLDLGAAAADLDIAIVDPLTSTRCPDGTAGEIWVSGPNVAVGYLGRPAESERTFCARLRGSTENYLRTNDFGFIHRGGLHVTEPRGALLAAL